MNFKNKRYQHVIQLLHTKTTDDFWDFRWFPPTPFWKFFKSFRPTHSTPLCKLKTENDKYEKLKKKDWNDIWNVSFLCWKYFWSPSLYVSSICQNFVSFPIQTALAIELGFRIQWIVCFKIWGGFDFFWIYAAFWNFSNIFSFW